MSQYKVDGRAQGWNESDVYRWRRVLWATVSCATFWSNTAIKVSRINEEVAQMKLRLKSATVKTAVSTTIVQDPTKLCWDLRSSGLLRRELWQFLTDISGQHIGPILKGQESKSNPNICYCCKPSTCGPLDRIHGKTKRLGKITRYAEIL